jgi:cysteine synthase A
MIYNHVDEMIGNTPMIRFPDLGKGNIFIKLEFLNPGGSVKDRIAKHIIERLEERGTIMPGDTLIEATSGNTGIGAAMIGAIKGYKVIIVMPENMSVERQQLIKAYGAEILLTPASQGMSGSIELAQKMVRENGYHMISQFENEDNYHTHETTTALEIFHDLNGMVDYIVCGVGTGGTLTGIGNALKPMIPGLKMVAVEPAESAVLSTGIKGSHGIQGIGAGFVPKILNTRLIDEIIPVTTKAAFNRTKMMALKYGLLLGPSSGAAIEAAVALSERPGALGNIVVIAPDGGLKYLSMEVFK